MNTSLMFYLLIVLKILKHPECFFVTDLCVCLCVCLFAGQEEGGVSTRLASDRKQCRGDDLRQECDPRSVQHRSKPHNSECFTHTSTHTHVCKLYLQVNR